MTAERGDKSLHQTCTHAHPITLAARRARTQALRQPRRNRLGGIDLQVQTLQHRSIAENPAAQRVIRRTASHSLGAENPEADGHGEFHQWRSSAKRSSLRAGRYARNDLRGVSIDEVALAIMTDR
ncbi:hypothetical protein GCM10009677_13130 [Sphaerisporangium rubeum]